MKELIELIGSENVYTNESMANHTTFKIGGNADVFVTPTNEEDLINVVHFCMTEKISYLIMGNGSNMLVSDYGIEGVVISSEKLDNVYADGDIIYAQSGAKLSKIANVAAKNSLTGFEFAAGIPGTVGGGAFMNAGAYDGELKDVICSVTVLSDDGIREITCCDCNFVYRGSIFQKKNNIILKVKIKLSPGNPEDITKKMQDFSSRRRSKQPLEYPSAGSTFKRPEGYFAGKLIEEANLKGCCFGGAMVSEKHSGFVINTGGASAADVIRLIEYIKKVVHEKYGVILEEEIKITGRKYI